MDIKPEQFNRLSKSVQQHIRDLERKVADKDAAIEKLRGGNESNTYFGVIEHGIDIESNRHYLSDGEKVTFVVPGEGKGIIRIRVGIEGTRLRINADNSVAIIPNVSNDFWVEERAWKY